MFQVSILGFPCQKMEIEKRYLLTRRDCEHCFMYLAIFFYIQYISTINVQVKGIKIVLAMVGSTYQDHQDFRSKTFIPKNHPKWKLLIENFIEMEISSCSFHFGKNSYSFPGLVVVVGGSSPAFESLKLVCSIPDGGGFSWRLIRSRNSFPFLSSSFLPFRDVKTEDLSVTVISTNSQPKKKEKRVIWVY